MSFYQDQQVRRYSLFLLFFLILTALAGSFLCLFQIHGAETLYLEHSRVLASSLLEQGVSKTVIARALCADAVSPEGSAFLTEIGLGKETSPWLLPLLSRLSGEAFCFLLPVFCSCLCSCFWEPFSFSGAVPGFICRRNRFCETIWTAISPIIFPRTGKEPSTVFLLPQNSLPPCCSPRTTRNARQKNF